jgi:hypothetical protein
MLLQRGSFLLDNKLTSQRLVLRISDGCVTVSHCYNAGQKLFNTGDHTTKKISQAA